MEIVRDGTLSGSPVWNSAGTTSTVEFDVAASGITGGEIIWAGYVGTNTTGNRLNVPLDNISNSDIPLTLNMAADASIPLSVVATSFGASTACGAAITWKETY